MQIALRQPSAPLTLSDIAQEFKQLDQKRRVRGLSLGEARRHDELLAQLSAALEWNEQHRSAEERRFLRVPFRLTLVLRSASGVLFASCHDFGGGGCGIACDADLAIDEEVTLEGADLEGHAYPLQGRAQVVWARRPLDPPGEPQHRYGLRFFAERRADTDAIDRLFYRVLDRFLRR